MVTFHQAIYALYPNVKSIADMIPYDEEGNEVLYDKSLVEAKALDFKKEADMKVQAETDTKQSALNKLMALGLTEEEALALGK